MNVCVKGPLIKPVWYPPGAKTWNNLNNGSFGVLRYKPPKPLLEIHKTHKPNSSNLDVRENKKFKSKYEQLQKKLSNTTNEIKHLNKTLVPTLERKITQLKDEIVSTEDNKHHTVTDLEDAILKYQDQDDNITFVAKEMAAKVHSRKKDLAQKDNRECISLGEEINRIKLLIEEKDHVINEMTDYKTKRYLNQKKMVAQLKEEIENNYKNFQKELNIFNHFSQKIKTQMLENFYDKMKSTLNEATQKTDVLKFTEVWSKYTDLNKRLVTTIIDLEEDISRQENYLSKLNFEINSLKVKKKKGKFFLQKQFEVPNARPRIK